MDEIEPDHEKKIYLKYNHLGERWKGSSCPYFCTYMKEVCGRSICVRDGSSADEVS